MKRLLVFLLFYIMMATSPSWADTTNSGATTNTQTNTRGSNTTISGGIRKNQQRPIKVGHHQQHLLQIQQTLIQAIVEWSIHHQHHQCQLCRKTFVL